MTDRHNNTLMVELSGDGTYWNINTAGIFKTSYGKNKKELYSRHTTAKQSAETVETSQNAEQGGTHASSSMSVPATPASKDTTLSSDQQIPTEENSEGTVGSEDKRASQSETDAAPAEAANDMKGILYESIFQGGSTQLREMFSELPAKAQKAILAIAYRDYDSPSSERMLSELQRSIIAYHELSRYAPFAKAKGMQELQNAIIMWERQYQMDESTGESYLPTEKYSNFALQLAAMYKGQTQRLTQSTLSRLFDLIQGTQEQDLFSDDTTDNTPRTLAQAIREVLNIEYNGKNGSNVLADDNAASTGRRQGSETAHQRDQQGAHSQQSADNTRGTEADGNNPSSKKSQTRQEVNIHDPRSMSDEEKQRRGEMLRDATVVEVADGQIVATADMSARKSAEKWWQDNVSGPLFYDTEAGEVEINQNSIEDSLAHRYGQAKLDAVTSLVEGFENAVYLGSMPDSNRQEGVMNHYYAYPIMYKGQRRYVFCRAMQDTNKNRLYVHEVFIADKIKEGDTLQTAAFQPHGGISLYKGILANVLFAGKDTDISPDLQANSEKSSAQPSLTSAKSAIAEGSTPQVTEGSTVPPGSLPSGNSDFSSPQESALSRIPVDEQGQPIYEQTDPDTAWDAILEQTEGDAAMAQEIAADMVSDKETELKKAQSAKPRKAVTVGDKIAAQKERKAAIDRAQSELDHWKQIAATQQRRAERDEAESAKAEASARQADKTDGNETETGRDAAPRQTQTETEPTERGGETGVSGKEQGEKGILGNDASQQGDLAEAKEMDGNGHPFVASSDGTTVFGYISENSGLKPAPIKLSLGFNKVDEKGNNIGYGLLHIEAGHGRQILKAGYSSVAEFVEDVSRNYGEIRIGRNRKSNQTYMLLELHDDKHKRTLYVELSHDGTYWNVNSGGIFRNNYVEKNDIAWPEPAVGSSADTSAAEVIDSSAKAAEGEAVDRGGNSSQPISSASKDTTLSSDQQISAEENSEGTAGSEGKRANQSETDAAPAEAADKKSEKREEDPLDRYTSVREALSKSFHLGKEGKKEELAKALGETFDSFSPDQLRLTAEMYASALHNRPQMPKDDWHWTVLNEIGNQLNQHGVTVKKGRAGMKEGDHAREAKDGMWGQVQSIDKESKTATLLTEYGEDGTSGTITVPLSSIAWHYRQTQPTDPLARAKAMEAEREAKKEAEHSQLKHKEVKPEQPKATIDGGIGNSATVQERRDALAKRLAEAGPKTKKEAWGMVAEAKELVSEYFGVPYEEESVRISNSLTIDGIKAIASRELAAIKDGAAEAATEKQMNFLGKLLAEKTYGIQTWRKEEEALAGVQLNKRQASWLIDRIKETNDTLYMSSPDQIEHDERMMHTAIDLMRKHNGLEEFDWDMATFNMPTEEAAEAMRKEKISVKAEEPASKSQQEDRLRRSLREAPASIIPRAAQRIFSKIAKSFGAEVRYLPTDLDSNGLYDPETNTIYLVLDATRALRFVFGHELTHMVRSFSSESYAILLASAREALGDKFSRLTDRKERLYRTHGYNYERDYYEEEAAADTIGMMIDEADMAQAILRRLTHPVLSRLRDALGHVLNLFRGEDAKNAARLMRDIEKAIAAAATSSQRQSDSQPRHAFAGEQGATAADRAESSTIRRDNLATAKEMSAQGKDAKAIKLATGWERGKDGKWRYEMPDARFNKEMKDALFILSASTGESFHQAVKMLNAEQYRLGKAMEADELFKAYPQLKQIQLFFDDTMPEDTAGRYSSASNAIFINARRFAPEMRSTLLHEMQHAIQHIEGFATGGNTRSAMEYLSSGTFDAKFDDMKTKKEVAYRISQEHELGLTRDEVNSLMERLEDNSYPEDKLQQHIDKLCAKHGITKDQLEDIYNMDAFWHEAYRRIAGEVEARNVQERSRMSEDERRNTPASETEDIPRHDQIILPSADTSSAISRGNASITNRQGDEIAQTDGRGRIKASLRTYDDWTDNLGRKHEGTRSMLTSHLKQQGFTDSETKGFTDSMDYWHAYLSKVADFTNPDGTFRFQAFHDWNQKQPQYKLIGEKAERTVATAIKNGEYAVNQELSTDCIKREAFTQLINTLIARGADLSSMGPVQINTIKDMMRKRGIQVACDLCFVEGKRLGIVNWAQSIVDDWNKALSAAGIDPDTAEPFNFGGYARDAQGNLLDSAEFVPTESLGSKDASSQWRAVNEVFSILTASDSQHYEDMKKRNTANWRAYRDKNIIPAWRKKKGNEDKRWSDKYLSKEQRATKKAMLTFGVDDPQKIYSNSQAYAEAYTQMEADYLKSNPDGAFTPTQQQQQQLDKIRNKEIKTVFAKMQRLIAEHPEMRKRMQLSDLLGSKGLMQIRQENGDAHAQLWSLILGRFGSGTPKPIQDAVPYAGEVFDISDQLISAAYQEGGARMFSFSDFDITKVFDIMQIYWDMAARRMKLQSYSKEAAYIIMFGKTGAKLNISTLPLAVVPESLAQRYKQTKPGSAKRKAAQKEGAEFAGLTTDENKHITGLSWSSEHSAKPDFCQQIFRDPERNANCGAVTVGASVNHCIYSAAQDWIRMVIPFHLSGMPLNARERTDVNWYYDNTTYQNTRVPVREKGKLTYKSINSPKIKLSDYNFYANEDSPAWDMRTECRNYLKWCESHGYKPRFEWGINSDRYRQWCESEGYTPSQQIIDIMDSDMTEGVWNGYYKFITDFTAYQPVLDDNGNPMHDEQGHLIETPARHQPVTTNISLSPAERAAIFGDATGKADSFASESVLQNRTNSINRANANMQEMARETEAYLKKAQQHKEGEISDAEMEQAERAMAGEASERTFFHSTDADLLMQAEQNPEGTLRHSLRDEEDPDTALRDALISHMRSFGMDVITDEAEGQRVLDMANSEEVKLSAKKRRALETASVSHGEKHQPTVVSSADGAKVLKELEAAKEKYENLSSQSKTFLGDVAKALGAQRHGSASEYATFETKSGRIVTIRLSNHNAAVSNFDHNSESEGISIVVSPKRSEGITNDGSAHVVEYYYDAIKLRRADGKPLADIVRSIKQALYSGEYKDTTGLAEFQEVNAGDAIREHRALHDTDTTAPVRFFRTPEGEAYGYTTGGKIYIDPRIATSETPIHEYTHLWSTALRKQDPSAWKGIVSAMRGTSLWDEVKSNYTELETDDDIADEVLAHYSGRRGASRLKAEMDKLTGPERPDPLARAAAMQGISRVRNALRTFWRKVASLLHIPMQRDADSIADSVLSDLLNRVDPRAAMSMDALSTDSRTSYHRVTDKATLDRLNNEPTERAYRAMQVINGKLYPPMAAKANGRLVEANELGEWIEADENKDLAIPDTDPKTGKQKTDKNGEPMWKFKLDKGKDATGKSGSITARYNPYWHLSRSPLNDQFKSAWIRPNIVIVECEFPVSELTSGYKAERAKDAVGEVTWKSGAVSGEVYKQTGRARKVILSRWCKPVRVLPDSEVAAKAKEFIGEANVTIPANVITPQQRIAFETAGITVGEPEQGMKKTEQVQEAIRAGLTVDNTVRRSLRDDSNDTLEESISNDDNIGLDEDTDPITRAQRMDEDSRKRIIDNDPEVSHLRAFTDPAAPSETRYSLRGQRAQNPAAAQVSASYDAACASRLFKLDEAWHDYLVSVRRAVSEIEKATGKRIPEWANPYMHALIKSSKDNAEYDLCMRHYLIPMQQAVQKLMRSSHMSLKDVELYLMAKHGLERNEVMRKRNAKKSARQKFAPQRKAVKAEHMAGHITDGDYNIKMQELGSDEQDEYQKNMRDGNRHYHKDYAGFTQVFADDDEQDTITIQELTQRADAHVKQVESRCDAALLDDVWNKIKAANDYSLKRNLDSGLINRETYDSISAMYKHYVPLRGYEDTEASEVYDYYIDSEPVSVNSVVKKASGRKSQAANVLANIMSMCNSAIVQANKNEVKQKLYNLATVYPSDLLGVSRVWYVREYENGKATGGWVPAHPSEAKLAAASTAAGRQQVYAEYEQEMQELKQRGEAKEGKSSLNLRYPIDAHLKRQHEVKVNIDGEEHIIYVNGNPRLAQALNGVLNYDAGQGWATRAWSSVMRFKGKAITSANPDFLVSNLQRDIISALSVAYAKYGKQYRDQLAKNIAANIPIMSALSPANKGQRQKIKGIYELYSLYNQDKLNLSDPRQRMFSEFVREGGETGISQMYSVKDYQHTIDAYMRDNLMSQLRHIANAIDSSIESANRGIENAVRFAAYCTSRETGKSITESVYDAKEASVNFNRKGSGHLFNALARNMYIFLNPAVQGTVQYIEMLCSHPQSGTINALSGMSRRALRSFAGFAVLGGVMTIANYLAAGAAGGDDDDDDNNGALDNAYANTSSYVRRSNVLIPCGQGVFAKIALAPETRLAYGIGCIAAEYSLGMHPSPSWAQDLTLDVAAQVASVLPLDIYDERFAARDSRSDLISNLVTGAVKGLTPTQLEPLTDAYLYNEDFAGRPIAWRPEKAYLPEYKYANDNTYRFLVNASQMLNRVAGGTDYHRSALDTKVLNPAIVEYLLTSYTGAYTEYPSKIYKSLLAAAGDERYQQLRNVPLVNRLIYSVSDKYSSASVTRSLYNEMLVESERVGQQVNALRADRSISNSERSQRIKEILSSPEGKVYLTLRSGSLATAVKQLQSAYYDMRESNREQADKAYKLALDLQRRAVTEYLRIHSAE